MSQKVKYHRRCNITNNKNIVKNDVIPKKINVTKYKMSQNMKCQKR